MQHPIYAKEETHDLSEKADRLLAMSRIGIAASDSGMNIDLQDCGYCGLFEQMAPAGNGRCSFRVPRNAHTCSSG